MGRRQSLPSLEGLSLSARILHRQAAELVKLIRVNTKPQPGRVRKFKSIIDIGRVHE